MFTLVGLVAASNVLAAPTLTLNPKTGPRDNGANTQTVIHGSGSFGVTIVALAVYWDTRDAAHQQTPTNVTLISLRPAITSST